MLLSINGNVENVQLDETNNIDLIDFSNFIEKYMGHEAYVFYTESLGNTLNYVEQLEAAVQILQEKLDDLEDVKGEEDAG